ncbi:unnamed protein product [Mytilus coruscus]|uniref:Uncharacterized protein n=1 Tax=Mytilus coruscus TaxID=42192 RepID=A0A6J8EYU5_MYTCO|nr:unnamed protein product [Mytilus coruscus]
MSVVLFQVIGWTALMLAARYGHLEICRLLIDTGCKIDTTQGDGKTALHLAAEWGHLQVIRCLVELGGASPLVKTPKGVTPYDLAAAKLKKFPRYKEVIEYLQAVMSEKSTSTAGPRMEDEVPTEIKLMTDKRSIDVYLKLLESGSEKKRDIRLVVVGKKGAGKTSLIKRLFGEDNTDVTSTNGIEIHKIKCKAMSDDGIWNKLDGMMFKVKNKYNKSFETMNQSIPTYFILRSDLIREKLQDKGTAEELVESHIAIKDNTPATNFNESKKSGTVYQQPKIRTPLVTTDSQVEPPLTTESQVEPQGTLQQQNQSIEQAKINIENA